MKDSGTTMVHLVMGEVRLTDVRLAISGYSMEMPSNILWDLSAVQDLNATALGRMFATEILPRARRMAPYLRCAILVNCTSARRTLRDTLTGADVDMELAVFADRTATLEWLSANDMDSAPNCDLLKGMPFEMDGTRFVIVGVEVGAQRPVAVLAEAQKADGLRVRHTLVEVLEQIAEHVEMRVPFAT